MYIIGMPIWPIVIMAMRPLKEHAYIIAGSTLA